MANYRTNLELWKAEQKRQFQEFIIDENELNKRLVGDNGIFYLASERLKHPFFDHCPYQKPPTSQTPDFTDEMTNSGSEKKPAVESLEARYEKQRGSELSIRHFKVS